MARSESGNAAQDHGVQDGHTSSAVPGDAPVSAGSRLSLPTSRFGRAESFTETPMPSRDAASTLRQMAKDRHEFADRQGFLPGHPVRVEAEALDSVLDALTMLRDAWNAHMETCPQHAALPSFDDLQVWRDAPSGTASA